MTRRWIGPAAAALAVLTLAGCGQPAAPPAGPPPAEPSTGSGLPPLPPRPVELPLAGVDPCALLTADQQATLGVRTTGERGEDTDRFGSIGCLWGSSSLPPGGAPLVRLVTAQGIDYYHQAGDTVIDIDGFPALQTTGSFVDAQVHCLVLIDIAAGQTLWTQYNRDGLPPNGITHELACDRARETARAMVSTLRARPGR